MKKEHIYEFFKRLCELNPEPKSDLEYTNPYTLLVAVILSAQSTDKGVNKATKDLFAYVDTPQKMVDLGIDKLKEHIRTIGLYNNKAKNIIAMSKSLINDFNGEVPNNRKDLMSLSGVGRKTANVVLNIAFEQPTIAVDTHIFRVANRTGLAKGKNTDEVEENLLKIVPKEFILHAHHWLILLGRYICKARKAECKSCPVYDLCEFNKKNM